MVEKTKEELLREITELKAEVRYLRYLQNRDLGVGAVVFFILLSIGGLLAYMTTV